MCGVHMLASLASSGGSGAGAAHVARARPEGAWQGAAPPALAGGPLPLRTSLPAKYAPPGSICPV